MSLSLSELHHLRDELIKARLGGIREVQDQNGERVVFKSDNEMRAAIEAVNREIQALDRQQPHTIRFKTSKGVL